MNRKKGNKDSNSFRYIFRYFFKLNNQRKGQVTIFIIIGLLLLFTFAAILYLTRSTAEEKLTAEGEPVVREAPTEFKPIQIYTENCLRQIGKRGLLILGEQGGYIYPELIGEYSSSNPTDSDGLNLEPLKVPYWHYNAEPNSRNKVSLASLQPKLFSRDDPGMSVEAQLSRFISERLDACLDSYSPFIRQGFEVAESPRQITVQVAPVSVNVLMETKLEAARGPSEHTFDQFFIKIPLELSRYYQLAAKITQAEKNYSFLERQGLDLIEIYSGVDPEKLPPTYDFRAGFGGIYWTADDVERKMTSLLATHIPMLRFLGSANMFDYQFPVSDLSPVYQANYDNMVLALDGGEGLSISFDYFNWPIYLHLTEDHSIGPQELLFTNTVSSFPQFTLAMQRYRNYYDVSYPVLISIQDGQALDGEGFSFNFALESNLRNNWIVEDGGETIKLPQAANSMVCDENKRNTELVKTIVVDSFSGEELEAVRIGLTIPEEKDCFIGQTDEHGELEAKYPLVSGGVVNFIKDDYLTNFYPIDTYAFREEPGLIGYAIAGFLEEVVPMHQFRMINVSVKKAAVEKCINGHCYFSHSLLSHSQFTAGEVVHSYQPAGLDSTHKWVFTGVKQSLSPDETATLSLERVSGNTPGVNEGFRSMAVVAGSQTSPIELVPGIYKVSGNLVKNGMVIFPAEERCIEATVIPVVWEPEECFDIEEMVLDSFMGGVIEWDEEGSYFEITPEQLYTSRELTFYILSQNILNVPEEAHQRVIEDLQVVGQLGNISKMPGIRQSLEPRFS